jgi:hypothetical protein
MIILAVSSRSCRVCKGTFVPFSSTQIVCGVKCARQVPIVARKAAKDDRKATKARIEELRPLSYWVKQAQVAFNAWVRERDRHLPCISCGRMHEGSWDAGHYLSTGSSPELRFDEWNVHRQCVPCNQHLHGNIAKFRQRLIERIGLARVLHLEGPHRPKQYRAAELKAIRDDCRARTKALQRCAS